MTRLVRFGFYLTVSIFFVSVAFPKSYKASRFDVELEVEPGGNLEITETIDFRFEGGPFTDAYRDIRLDECDGLGEFRAFMDGKELRADAGERPGLEIERGRNSVRATWHFSPTSDALHSFVLRYRVLGAVRRQDGNDLLLWRVIPSDHDYKIESAQVTVNYPPGVMLAGQPDANRHVVFQSSSNQTVYDAGRLGKEKGLSVRIPFVQGALLKSPPGWQRQAERRRAELWTTTKLALATELPVLVAGVVLIVLLRRSQSPAPVVDPGALTAPPDDLRPALVGVLMGSWSDWRAALSTLISLAGRGFIEIEAKPKSWLKGREFSLRRKEGTGILAESEAVLLRLAFGSAEAHSEELPIRRAQRQIWRHWRQFKEALRQEARNLGFLDPDRQATRRGWLGWGVAILCLAAAGTAGLLLVFARQERLLPIVLIAGGGIALFTLGLLVVILGSTLTPLTDAARMRKKKWEAFKKHLKELADGTTSLQPEWLGTYLPYAIVLGLGNQWAKAFKDRGIPARIAWLAGSEQFDGSEIATLVAVLGSSGAAHSSGGGGGGAGGGGGSSGAG